MTKLSSCRGAVGLPDIFWARVPSWVRSQPVVCLFFLVTLSFSEQNFYMLIMLNLLILFH